MQSFSCANHMANGRNGTCCFLDFPYHCILLINLAGLPAIMEPSGKDLVTTALAPITQHSPMVTPGIMQTFSPIHVYEPMTMGPLEDNGRFRGIILIVSIVGFLELSVMRHLGPMSTLSPISILLMAVIWA